MNSIDSASLFKELSEISQTLNAIGACVFEISVSQSKIAAALESIAHSLQNKL